MFSTSERQSNDVPLLLCSVFCSLALFTGHLLHIHYVPGTVVTKKTRNHQSLQTDATSGRCRVTGPIKSHRKLAGGLSTHLFIHSVIIHSLTYSFYKYSLGMCSVPCPVLSAGDVALDRLD